MSSLSSRITEDVRTKGNKSVFVRVGEGLYTLRKGLKKSELEKFLNTKYPHMTHNLDADLAGSSVRSSEGEEEVVEPPPAPKPRPQIVEPTWVGLPLKTKMNGDVYYSSVQVGKHRYRIGDCALFTPNSEDQSPYIGQILKLWQAYTSGTSHSSIVFSD